MTAAVLRAHSALRMVPGRSLSQLLIRQIPVIFVHRFPVKLAGQRKEDSIGVVDSRVEGSETERERRMRLKDLLLATKRC